MELLLISLFWTFMFIELNHNGRRYTANLSAPLDISIPLSPDGPRAWYVDPMEIEPVRTVHFTGSVAEGGDVNFRNIRFNPHGHGTHTETVGHIDREIVSINQTLKQFFFHAKLVTIHPTIYSGVEEEFKKLDDHIITAAQLKPALENFTGEAIVIRTLPNDIGKNQRNYTGTNPPYFEPEALSLLRDSGIAHLLTDLPSVDRESDGGKLLSHRAFWHGTRPDDHSATITEMIFVSDEIPDGQYLLNIQIAPFENDASPSKPVLYTLNEIPPKP